MKLIELYSLASGLKIGKQHLEEAFYPLPVGKYITIQSGSGMAAKNYPHYSEVMSIMSSALSKAGISIVQIGGKDDAPMPGAFGLQGKTNLHQSNHILSRAICHLGNDSWACHRAGEVGVPVVALFGPTSPKNHSPYKYHEKSVFLESHRFGRRPTFANQESQPTISVIPPERVANSVLECLGLPERSDRKTIYIGPDYNSKTIELVPDVVVHPNVQISAPVFVRMDYHFNEDVLANNLALRKCVIMTDREINVSLLSQFRQQILLLKTEVDEVSPDWIKKVSKLGVKTEFYSTEKDEAKLASKRLEFYDACFFDRFQASTKEDFVKFVGTYLNNPLDPGLNFSNLSFKTNKILLSGGKVYLSKSHWLAGQHTESADHNAGKVIDEPAFWEEVSHGCYFTP